MFDADRQPDGRIEHADPLAHIHGHAGMGHGGGVAGEGFGAAEADCQLEDLQRIQEFEGCRLAAANIEREGGTGTGALRGKGAAER